MKREYFALFPDQVMMVAATASGSSGRGVSADFEVTSLHPQDRLQEWMIDRGTAGIACRSWTWDWRANLWARLR